LKGIIQKDKSEHNDKKQTIDLNRIEKSKANQKSYNVNHNPAGQWGLALNSNRSSVSIGKRERDWSFCPDAQPLYDAPTSPLSTCLVTFDNPNMLCQVLIRRSQDFLIIIRPFESSLGGEKS